MTVVASTSMVASSDDAILRSLRPVVLSPAHRADAPSGCRSDGARTTKARSPLSERRALERRLEDVAHAVHAHVVRRARNAGRGTRDDDDGLAEGGLAGLREHLVDLPDHL